MRAYSALSALVFTCLCVLHAHAISGGAPTATGEYGRSIVMIRGASESLCTGTAIARDVVLTAAHCAPKDVKLTKVVAYNGARPIDVVRVLTHPNFNMDNYQRSRATADVALFKLAEPLPGNVVPATVGTVTARPGDKFTVAGFGTVEANSAAGLGSPRVAQLSATGQPGNLQLRLYDPATRGERIGLGGCTGDSGAPAFANLAGAASAQVVGIVSWSTGPNLSAGCGGLTGVTPLNLYHGWVTQTARELGSVRQH